MGGAVSELSAPWSFDFTTGRVNDAKGKPIAFVSARRQTIEDPFGQRIGNTLAAAPELYEMARAADDQITAIHEALGAPGDYGYESPAGRALYALYKFQVELRAALAKARGEPKREAAVI